MTNTVEMLLIICPMVFLAGFADAIAGGGGLISLPAYLFTGLPVHLAYGTNKFSAAFGTLFSTLRFMKSGQINRFSSFTAAAGALAGSFPGAEIALALNDRFLKYCLLVLLPLIAIFVMVKRDFGEERSDPGGRKKVFFLSLGVGFSMGVYDGFFGPGTGTFLIIAFTVLIGFDLRTAAGNTKVVNLASNAAALIAFLTAGKVVYILALPAAVFGIFGNWLGTGLAIKNGRKIIRPVFIVVLILLFVKIITDII